MSFFQDWGPLNVAMVYKACIFIHSLLIVSSSLSVGSDSGILGCLDSCRVPLIPQSLFLGCLCNKWSLYALLVHDAHVPFQDEDLASHRLILYTSDDPQRKANAALLMALFSVRVSFFLSFFLVSPSLANCTTTRTLGSLSAYR